VGEVGLIVADSGDFALGKVRRRGMLMWFFMRTTFGRGNFLWTGPLPSQGRLT